MLVRFWIGIIAVTAFTGMVDRSLTHAQPLDLFVADLPEIESLPAVDDLPPGSEEDAELPAPYDVESAPLDSDETLMAPLPPNNSIDFQPPALEPVPTIEPDESYVTDTFLKVEPEIVSQEMICERFPNGQVKIERGVSQDENDNYFNHGPWRMFDPQGKLIVEGTYRFGQRDGKWSRLQLAEDSDLYSVQPFNLFNEPFLSEAEFQNGKLHGSWVIRDGADLKVCEWRFVDGFRHGDSTWFYHNGRTMRVIQYRQGEIHGELTEWDVNGDSVTSVNYQNGRRLEKSVEHYDDRRKKLEGMVLKARIVVQDPDDWWQNKLATYQAEGNDEKHGKWTAWYPSGQKRFTGEYVDDEATGTFVWWHENGQKMLQGLYEQGEKIGQWTWWHENGIKSIQGNYLSNSPVDSWIWWHESGRVAQRINYSGDSDTSTVEAQTPTSVQRFFRRFDRSESRR